jgi:hypothetical protein
VSNKPKTITKRILVAPKLPKRINDYLTYAKSIVKAMTGNPNFPLPFPVNVVPIATLSADIQTLDTAETASKTKAKGTADTRNAAKVVVDSDLHSLVGYVQSVADKTSAQSEAIILSAGMNVKKSGAHSKPDFVAKNDKVSGTVLLSAKGSGGHEWQQSTDGINWTNLPATAGAKTKVTGLTSVTKMYFRSRAILRKGQQGAWSQMVSVAVT